MIFVKSNGPNNSDGGILGFESSILSIAFQVLAIIVVLIVFKRRQANNEPLIMRKNAVATSDIALSLLK